MCVFNELPNWSVTGYILWKNVFILRIDCYQLIRYILSILSVRTWVTDGIETTMMDNTVICETSHLTTFAVLIDPTLATVRDLTF